AVRLGEPIPQGSNPVAGPASPSLPPLPPLPPSFPMPATTIVPDVTPSARPARVGEILIFGADITKDRVIRRQIPFQPREILSFPDLRLAERNLASLGIFVVDPQTGVRPTVTVAPDEDSEFKTIWVQVQEAPTTGFLFGASVNSNAG